MHILETIIVLYYHYVSYLDNMFEIRLIKLKLKKRQN